MPSCDDRTWAIIVRILNFLCGVLMATLGVLKFFDHDEDNEKLIYCKKKKKNFFYYFFFYRYIFLKIFGGFTECNLFINQFFIKECLVF